jgi:hypothetical protein
MTGATAVKESAMAKRKRTIDKTIEKMGDDLAIESLQHAQMNKTRDYAERGRALASLTDDEVKSVWVAMFETWFDEKTPENGRNMNDADAELRLRDLEPPYDRVKAKTDELQAELKRRGPDAFSEELDKENDEFLAARAKPKN